MHSTSHSNAIVSVATGPSGRAIAEAIDPDLLNGIRPSQYGAAGTCPALRGSNLVAERELRDFQSSLRTNQQWAWTCCQIRRIHHCSWTKRCIKGCWSTLAELVITGWCDGFGISNGSWRYNSFNSYTPWQNGSAIHVRLFFSTQWWRCKLSQNTNLLIYWVGWSLLIIAAALLLIDNELDQGNNKPASLQG